LCCRNINIEVSYDGVYGSHHWSIGSCKIQSAYGCKDFKDTKQSIKYPDKYYSSYKDYLYVSNIKYAPSKKINKRQVDKWKNKKYLFTKDYISEDFYLFNGVELYTLDSDPIKDWVPISVMDAAKVCQVTNKITICCVMIDCALIMLLLWTIPTTMFRINYICLAFEKNLSKLQDSLLTPFLDLGLKKYQGNREKRKDRTVQEEIKRLNGQKQMEDEKSELKRQQMNGGLEEKNLVRNESISSTTSTVQINSPFKRNGTTNMKLAKNIGAATGPFQNLPLLGR
jgi:hypothetical protein